MCSDGLAHRTNVRNTTGVTRTRVRWDRLAALTLLTVGVLGLAGRAFGDAPEPRPRVLVIEAGQTLWSIARSEVGAEGDPRPLIEEIRELNQLGAAGLEVGQRLRVPAG